jgi:TatD DNase family protein
MKLIDTHAHLDLQPISWPPTAEAGEIPSSFSANTKILRRARAAGVEKIVTIGSSLAESHAAVAIAEKEERIFATVGIHPDEVADFSQEEERELRALAGKKKVVAIGEIGFDFFGEKKPPAEIQEVAFRAQLALARELSLPAVIHLRDADEEGLRVLRDFEELPLVVHCFQSGEEVLEAIEKNPNWRASFGGLVTFPKTEKILAALRRLPFEKIFLETDAPFLAPVPHRGKANEPAFLPLIAKKIAAEKEVSFEKVAEETTLAAEGFFKI